MKLYNTLTRSVDELQPLQAPKVTAYTCGPTVYDYPHVGNWFTYVREDILIRTLRASGLQPEWVMNITDVGHLVSDADDGEDKLEKGAKREGKTAWEVADFYTKYFAEGLKRLNILKPDMMPLATEHIPEQIALIQKLEAKGFTYIIDDGVYYDTAKFPRYGDFAQLDLDEQQAGARVQINSQKRNPTDFALWKFSPADHKRDMEWNSPWGTGFPGWHIECSAMSMTYLGDTLDIHAGGIDHLPVHHTNEIAQSEAVTGKPFANYWMHSNHITIEGDKISKSLGNGITLEDIEARGISLEAFRLHILESHYRSQSKFSWDSLLAAQNRLSSYTAFADLLWELPDSSSSNNDVLGTYQQAILMALQDDLNTPQVLAKFSELESRWLEVLATADKPTFASFLKFLDAVLGLNLSATHDISDQQYGLLEQRNQARQAKDWAKSDEIRDQLAEQGIGLRDTANGAIWYRI